VLSVSFWNSFSCQGFTRLNALWWLFALPDQDGSHWCCCCEIIPQPWSGWDIFCVFSWLSTAGTWHLKMWFLAYWKKLSQLASLWFLSLDIFGVSILISFMPQLCHFASYSPLELLFGLEETKEEWRLFSAAASDPIWCY